MNRMILTLIGLVLVSFIITVPAADAVKKGKGGNLTVNVRITEGFEQIICVVYKSVELKCVTTKDDVSKVKITGLEIPAKGKFTVVLYGEFKAGILKEVDAVNKKASKPQKINLEVCGSNEVFSHIENGDVYCTDLLDDSGPAGGKDEDPIFETGDDGNYIIIPDWKNEELPIGVDDREESDGQSEESSDADVGVSDLSED